MQASSNRHRILTLAFLLALALPPLAQVAVDLRVGRAPGVVGLFTQHPTATGLRTFEDDIEGDSWFVAWARPVVQQAKFLLFRDPGQDAVVGRDGWLFYTPGLQYLTETGTAQKTALRQCVAAVCDFQAQLAARGIHLVVVPAPGKASIYSDKLRAGTQLRSPTHDLIGELAAAGVDTVDVFEVFSDARRGGDDVPLYLVQDTHWSPRGAQLAAETVAEHILASGRVVAGAIHYGAEPVAVSRLGDIIRMARVPALEKRIRPEAVQCMQVSDPDTGRPYRDDANSQVLVLGDSFLRIYESDEPTAAGFIAHLARGLRQPVASVVNDGGASTLVRQTLARKPELLEGKKVVIWEFVERDIRFGAEGWQIVSLPPAASTAGDI